MRTYCRTLVLGVVFGLCLNAAVQSIEITERSPVLGGRSFGDAGPYERVVAKVHFRVDPANAANRTISDIDLAPVDEDGMVAFTADLSILKPVDPKKGNGTILFDVLNRGNKMMLSFFDQGAGSNDPRSAADFGDGFLLNQGYYLVWLGWQFDVPHEPGRMRVIVPVAKNKDGSPITGLVRADFVPSETLTRHSLADRGHIAYPVLDPDDPKLVLTVRDSARAARRPIPRDRWHISEDRTAVEMPSGFEAGMIYEIVYRAQDPALVGLGLAGVRDIVSFLKYGAPGQETPLVADSAALARAIGFGISQSGRYLRTLLYYGFNRDEQGRQVFDAVWAHIAGAGRGGFNNRFAQPSRDGHPHSNFFFPTDIFPFTDLPQTDPETGLTGGILERAIADKVVPKIFYTNGSYEYWGRAASLIHTTLDGTRDAEIAPDTRIYFVAGTQHGSQHFPPSRAITQNLTNPTDYTWAMRALLVALNQWTAEGVEPPPSQYPHVADDGLVPVDKLDFPKLPGIRIPVRTHLAYRVDYGPDFYSRGIISREPPTVGAPFRVLVPRVDADGNEIDGIRHPIHQAALGTFTGWNFRAPSIGAPEQLSDMIGSYFPFARTEAERKQSGDPRPSVAERYQNRDAYLARLRESAEALAAERFLLPADIDAVVEEGAAQWEFVMGRAGNR